MASSSIWTAPADLCGRGGTAMRPSLVGAVPVVQGSGLPVAGMAPRFRDRVAIGTGVGPALLEKTSPSITRNDQFTQNDQSTQNDGTTPGIHPSGRPRS